VTFKLPKIYALSYVTSCELCCLIQDHNTGTQSSLRSCWYILPVYQFTWISSTSKF